jgi:myo-inositol 2-dehydrogenase/D-chiro-inositol 1-dehydrogenase
MRTTSEVGERADQPEEATSLNSGRFTRRRLLTAAGTGGLLIVSPQVACTYKANSRVSFGVIGTGRRGNFVASHMAKDPHGQLTAICDIYPDRLEEGRRVIPGASTVRSYRDINELLAQADIDAVLIATPVFLHPTHFEAAVKARKHIYCEKPAAASVAGAKRLLAAGASADPTRSIVFGFQQRYSPQYLKAKSLVAEGRIGDLKLMSSYWILANMLDGRFEELLPPGEEQIRRWEFYRETSGCPIVEQDCHGVDIMNWFAGGHPFKAVGTGGLRYPLCWGDWTSDHHNITYSYAGGIEGNLVSVKERHAVAYRDVREMIWGSTGVIETARTYYKVFGNGKGSLLKSNDDLRDGSLVEHGESKREITADAAGAFFASIVGNKPIHDTEAAVSSTLTSLLGRMAYETGRAITWEEMLSSE